MIKPQHGANISYPFTLRAFLVSPLHFSLLMICLCFGGCDSISHKSTDASADDWPIYQDELAASYIASCKRAYQRARDSFEVLENAQPGQPRDILTDINNLEILANEPLGQAGLYANVHPNESVRAAGDICEQKFMALHKDINLSRPIYDRLLQVNLAELSGIDRYYAEQTRQLFELAGVGLEEKQRARVRELNAEIVKLGQAFLANMREDTRKVTLTAQDLAGLPEDFIAKHPADAQGNVVLSTDYPDYFPLMQYAASDEARRKMYVAFRQRGYPANKAVLKQLLTARHELANLLGYSNFADYITADKMIGSATKAADFIDQITVIAKPRADQDYATLLQRLQQIQPGATHVSDWQKTYLENLIRNEVYAVDPQEVRQYFSYAKVKTGIFTLVEDLFGVQIKPWQTDVWHPSVEAYEVWENGKLLGQFYLDMHPRPGKYQHAAQFGIRDGVKGVQTPLAALVCNFAGGDGGVDLLEHDEVETFLHEFGHLLHTLFGGDLPWARFAGTNTQRDFVEAPSQMLEEWVWDLETLHTFARNSAGEPIPAELVRKMNAARNFGQGIFVRHQMFYAALSLNYYNRDPATLDLDRLMIDLQNQYSPFPYVEDTYLYASFGHLDGYSAMYYTYMWSKVIAADMFREFEKNGLRNRELASRYRHTVLAAGASRPAANVVQEFLGRPFNFDAFAESMRRGISP
jgi:Zn-dependent oligopeptidases